jgi:hypothetical protein
MSCTSPGIGLSVVSHAHGSFVETRVPAKGCGGGKKRATLRPNKSITGTGSRLFVEAPSDARRLFIVVIVVIVQ